MNISCGRPKQWYDRCPIGVVLPTNWVTVPNRYTSPNYSGGTLSRWVGYPLPTIWKPRVVSLKFWGYLNSVIPSVQHCKRGNVHLVPCYSHTMHVFRITCLIKPTWRWTKTTYLKLVVTLESTPILLGIVFAILVLNYIVIGNVRFWNRSLSFVYIGVECTIHMGYINLRFKAPLKLLCVFVYNSHNNTSNHKVLFWRLNFNWHFNKLLVERNSNICTCIYYFRLSSIFLKIYFG